MSKPRKLRFGLNFRRGIAVFGLLMMAACGGVPRQGRASIPVEVVSLSDDLKVTGQFRCQEARPGIDAPEVPVYALGGVVLNSRETDRLVGVSFVVSAGGESFEEYDDVSAGPRLTHFPLRLRVPKGLTACKITLGESGRPPPAGWKPCPEPVLPPVVGAPPQSVRPVPGGPPPGPRCYMEPRG